MTRDELARDLAYVRTLAEEGRYAPLLGGSFLLFWGQLNLIAYVAQWALLEGYLPRADGMAFAVLWGGYGVVAALGSVFLGRRVRAKPGHSSLGVRAESAIWIGVAAALGAVALGSIARMVLDHDLQAPNAIMGAAFALFGAALLGTAMLAREKWLGGFASVAFLAAAALSAFANQNWAYLLAAAACAIVLIAPGFILLRREPSALV